jgi:hypothetical protein
MLEGLQGQSVASLPAYAFGQKPTSQRESPLPRDESKPIDNVPVPPSLTVTGTAGVVPENRTRDGGLLPENKVYN